MNIIIIIFKGKTYKEITKGLKVVVGWGGSVLTVSLTVKYLFF